MQFDEAASRDMRALRVMLEVAYACIVRNGLDARARGDAEGEATARTALTLLLESTLMTLNSHIDGAIAACELSTNPKVPTVAATRAPRTEQLSRLEVRFTFDRTQLPGWDAVSVTNDQSNAVKHRLGLTWATGTTTPLSITDSVEIERTKLLSRTYEVEAWVTALGRTTGLLAPGT